MVFDESLESDGQHGGAGSRFSDQLESKEGLPVQNLASAPEFVSPASARSGVDRVPGRGEKGASDGRILLVFGALFPRLGYLRSA